MKRIFILTILLCGAFCVSVSAQKQSQEQLQGLTNKAERALVDYINNGDKSCKWQEADKMRGEGCTIYRLDFTSQTWRESVWSHQLMVIVPDKISHDEVLLHVAGGSVDTQTNMPNLYDWNHRAIKFQAGIATRCEAVTAILWHVPRQPLYGNKYEDELLSFTLHKFQQDKDYTWPLLFPMVKSVVRAMDTIEEFTQQKHNAKVNKFVINGFSKRGWTTWLTAGTGDKRVVAIAPMVIDILNMRVSVPYQKHMFGSYSIMIQDYIRLGLTEELVTPSGLELVKMIDPYSYREQYTMPKMVFLGSNDPYWTVDAVKNYIDEIPGTKYTAYSTNAGHDLDGEAITSLEAFFYQTINGAKYPKFDYTPRELADHIAIDIKADKKLLKEVIVWEATSENKDFRKCRFEPTKVDGVVGKKSFTVNVDYPKEGFKAFIVMLKYKNPTTKQDTYNISTRMYTADNDELFEEAYEIASSNK
ncbi:MAG: PhoPQ-activated pathogenicity-like protein PqaA type [Alistipes sp.]|nr:PhoPQ-activated pathogenicity-like protein PqaA type [Alistipes sp.]